MNQQRGTRKKFHRDNRTLRVSQSVQPVVPSIPRNKQRAPLCLYPTERSCRTRARICRWLTERLAVYQESRQVERERNKAERRKRSKRTNKRGRRDGCERGRGAERGNEEKERKKEGWWGWYERLKHVEPTPCVSFSSALGCLRTISHRMSIELVRRIQRSTFGQT